MSEGTLNPLEGPRPVVSHHAEGVKRSWRAIGRPVAVFAIALGLALLGASNIVSRAHEHRVEDGVLWGARPEGLTALAVGSGTGASRSGILPGDVLVAVNGSPVSTLSDLNSQQQLNGTPLSYTLVRLGSRQMLDVTLAPPNTVGSVYYALAGVGLFSLLVGASVCLRRPRDPATLHFFWLCIALFGVLTFSFNGPFDRLDWIYYWGDAVAMLLLPPLLFHFTLVFPERPPWRAHVRLNRVLPFVYLPAVVLGLVRVTLVAREPADGAAFSRILDEIDRAEHIYLSVCTVASIAVLMRAFREITSNTGVRQLRWIAWGTVLGGAPFALGSALPWALGLTPPLALQWSAVLLGLVPLAFASAIVRYRLRDVEVIIKRGLGYAAFLGASAALYVALEKLVGFVFSNEGDPHTRVVALLATFVVVLIAQPVKEAMQNAVDRAFYRSRYDYRRALLGFARDLNSDLDVVRLSHRLVTRIVETLGLDRMALMLADERIGDFRSIGDYGFAQEVARLPRSSSFLSRLEAGRTVALDDPMSAAWYAAEDVEYWRDQGIYYFVPCIFEGSVIAVLALGHKETDEPCSSEDLGLLTAVAGQVATAIENGRLYRQLHLKAEELGRMRQFNDNILESLDAGLVVFDGDERIVRWNRALEEFYGVTRDAAVQRTLSDLFDAPFVEALRAARRERPEGATLFKVPLSRPAGDLAGETETERLLVNATVVPLKDLSSTVPTGTILLIEDITNRVRLEEQLQISEKMASIGLLAAGVAHEVNTPLTGISSFTQMLLDGADPADPKTVLLEKIERQTFRAAKIVNGLLTLSRPGTPGTERMPVDLNAVINDVISLLEHQFEVGRIRLRREMSPDAVTVSGIEHQLQQVFLNLFLNARDAMPRGGWLGVATRVDDDHVTVEVADTGSGIPPEQLARIYDPFFTTKAIGRGTGLGLSIIYGIVREHDGSIRCESTVGQGTRFAITLPLARRVARSIAH
jgi:PAS domain S-box-containing protein